MTKTQRNGSSMGHICRKLFDNAGETIFKTFLVMRLGQGHSDPETKYDILWPQVVCINRICESFLK